jgi:hypothetical protein
VERGRETLANGALLQEAEAAGFEVFITTDKNIRYPQHLTRRRIAILVLENAQWPILRQHVRRVVAAVNAATPGSYTEFQIPHSSDSATMFSQRFSRSTAIRRNSFGYRPFRFLATLQFLSLQSVPFVSVSK